MTDSDKARADLGKRIDQMQRWQRVERYGPLLGAVAIIAVVVAAIGVVKWFEAHGLAARQFTLRMRPAAPLSMTACIAEANHYGWPVTSQPSVCSAGKGRAWHHAVLSNHGGGAYPLCHATGYDARGRTAFSGTLFFNFGDYPAGLYAKRHRSVAFSWYMPSHVPRPIARYLATCTVNNNPPI